MMGWHLWLKLLCNSWLGSVRHRYMPSRPAKSLCLTHSLAREAQAVTGVWQVSGGRSVLRNKIGPPGLPEATIVRPPGVQSPSLQQQARGPSPTEVKEFIPHQTVSCNTSSVHCPWYTRWMPGCPVWRLLGKCCKSHRRKLSSGSSLRERACSRGREFTYN